MNGSFGKEVVVPVIFALILFVLFGLTMNKVSESQSKDTEFKGVCNYLGGQVHDNLCIKGDKVILRQKS